jgi:hypothetical protein
LTPSLKGSRQARSVVHFLSLGAIEYGPKCRILSCIDFGFQQRNLFLQGSDNHCTGMDKSDKRLPFK